MGSYVSVNVYVVEDDPARKPVEGVVVRVFDESNKNFFTQDTTDAEGKVGFTLFSETRFHLRFYKYGAQIKQPQVIDVLEPPYGQPQLNSFEVKATVFQHPVANDARLCRASGFFRDVTGGPHENVDIQVIGKFEPILLDGAGILSERRTIRTDSKGFACIDLIRCARYAVLIQGHEDEERQIDVPDLPSVSLPDLLFPVVEEVTLTPTGPYKVQVGEVLSLTPTVVGTNRVPLEGTAPGDVRWLTSDDSVLSVSVGSTTLTLTGRKKGTAELRAERLDRSIIRIPDKDILGLPQTIQVY